VDGARFGAISTASLPHLAAEVEFERSSALRPGDRYTLAQVAERAGVSIERVRQLHLAAGLPPSPPAAPVFTDDDVLVFRGFAGGAGLFGEAPILRFVRTVGSSLARIAEAARALFLVNVEGRCCSRG